MKKPSIVIFLLFIGLTAFAQTGFQKIYLRDYGSLVQQFDIPGFSIQQTADGGYIFAGTAYGLQSNNNKEMCLVKIDSMGDTLWTKTYGGTTGELGFCVRQVADGGYIFAGAQTSGYEGYLIRTNATGDTLWTKTYDKASGGGSYIKSIRQTSDGGFILVGETGNGVSPSSGHDIYVIKTDSAGNSSWAKAFHQTTDYGQSVEQTTDGGYIVAGFGGLWDDVLLLKLNSSGDTLWTKNYGVTGWEDAFSVVQTNDGGYIVAGNSENFSNNLHDIYVIKTDALGDTLWTRIYYVQNNPTYGYSIQQTADGGYVIGGWIFLGNHDDLIIKTDSSGAVLWSKRYGNSDYNEGYSTIQTNDGGYTILGRTFISFSWPSYFYLVKTDSSGNSGCNEISVSIAAMAVPTQVSSNPYSLATGVGITSHAMAISSVGADSTLCRLNTGIEEESDQQIFAVYPNPSHGEFTLQLTDKLLNGRIEIYNVYGNIVFTEEIINKSKKEISLKNISNGIYFVKVFDEKNSYCKILIVN